MDKSEFDKFADEYTSILSNNIKITGEKPDFFAEYKIKDTALIASKNALPSQPKILDFGGGTGTSVPYFRKHFPQAELTCLDVSEKSIEIAQQRFPKQANYTVFGGNTIPYPDNSFHIIFTACVFHHIDAQHHGQSLKEIFRVLAPGGFFIVFEHNPYNPLTRKAVNTCPFDENAVLITCKNFKEKLRENGFSNVHAMYRIFFPKPLAFLRPMEQYMGWLPLGAQYYAIGYKK